MLTQDRLKELLHYDPEMGVFTWLVNRRGHAKAGDLAGSVQVNGYVEIGVDCQRYTAHRLAFLYMTGEWPANEVDHKDRDRANNRWANLRPATNSQNGANGMWCNTTSGYKGVHLHRKTGKFMAQIKKNGKNVYLGLFADPIEAHAVYAEAATKLHGEFARAA